MSVPVKPPDEEKWYTPGRSVIPPKSWPVRSVVGVKAANALYAVWASLWAAIAVASAPY